ncbi:hypothetical protein BBK14_09845 [Parafrankia soli]|uniref:Uncharacterized protein n=1 Tax=Parafrankia soli TaxID=2599596 RepID=A0A1S1RII8_9ACTN|nr:hypothetical protein [Parafrankia soli]OHV45052.1 hypothetical protein BBK14_09845 [Parafrankia soli]
MARILPRQAAAAGASRDVELLAGHTRDEQRLFTVFTGLLGQVTPEEVQTAASRRSPRRNSTCPP